MQTLPAALGPRMPRGPGFSYRLRNGRNPKGDGRSTRRLSRGRRAAPPFLPQRGKANRVEVKGNARQEPRSQPSLGRVKPVLIGGRLRWCNSWLRCPGGTDHCNDLASALGGHVGAVIGQTLPLRQLRRRSFRLEAFRANDRDHSAPALGYDVATIARQPQALG